MLRRHMDDAMQVLTPRERQVLCLLYGLTENGREHTLVELGKMLGVSPERVRQVECAALHKLRKPAMRRRLRDYLDEYISR
jgi:RNA polymerase sigma factor (sigma-70 family)